MRTSFSIVLCVLVMTMDFASQAVTGARTMTSQDGREPTRRLSPPEDGKRFKVADGGMEKDNVKVGTTEEGEFENGEDGEELIYNVDYHGVTTHPSPSPKHPKPRN